MEEEKLEAQMEYAKYEHETELLRERKICNIDFFINYYCKKKCIIIREFFQNYD